ncbi:FAD/NAD(P)-binding protein [Actinoplanes sp. CA-252034]|uniref:FAD/NAD(P)-binding protein n=1 Tax=Actinoplanes sp. CA-252034 TaxID=3239906 RepID=UPI003D9554C6
MGTDAGIQICIVGAGPRGLSVLERLCANERAARNGRPVTVHVVDPWAPGAGAVWRSDQSHNLLMNTVASQITLYTDDSVSIAGPIEPGPSLYEWATADDRAEGLGPDSYPTRALYGHYLEACFERVVREAPETITVRVHRSRAVAMADTHGVPGGPQGVRLEDGTRLNELHAIVMAQGHVAVRLTPREARTASLARIHYLTYVTPANPADVDLSAIEPGRPVLLRGLGLNFFDYMALLSAGRGGSFRRDPATGRLTYHASGAEPRMYAFSRRGVPYHARGRNEKGAFGRYEPRLLTAERLASMRSDRTEPLNFTRDLWPLISREVESAYYGVLLAGRGDVDRDRLVTEYLTTDATGLDALLDRHGVEPADRWRWETLVKPFGDRTFADHASFRAWLLEYLARDVAEADRGNLSSPLKAALDVLRDLRNEIRIAVDHSGLDGDSHRDDLEGWYTPLNAFLSIGPPASRIEEMIALIEAGVLDLLGPSAEVRVDTSAPAFVARCAAVPGPPVAARALIEARLPEPDLRRTDDPLLRHLLETEQCAPYRIATSAGSQYETGGLAVTERPYHLLDARGRPHPRRFAFSVPTESVHWVTAAGIRPGVDSVTLADSDAIARTMLGMPPVAEVPVPVRLPRAETDLTGVLV